ncbi:unnamed protein product [Paramecium primaurelia]|uniref:NACHT domain-containing protein n=1 Tax=Paramecium primaurelia TaxID=5886 RepID=A0A8S1QDQ3_PARPR|nr:unnamed protein product [Paramecium primaurelia]
MITNCLSQYYNNYSNQSEKKLYSEGFIGSQIMFEKFYITMFENFHSQFGIDNPMKLRGGGCGQLKAKNHNQLLHLDSVQLPDNFLIQLNNYLKFIVDEAPLLFDATKKNKVIKRIQWFIYNREHLNYLCNNEKVIFNFYEMAKANFENLLTVLVTYLRSSWFVCYQVLQICNDLLRVIYTFLVSESKRFLKEEEKQDYISKLSKFETQLEIEQANVWKTGLEFEIKIMKIMILNSKTDSTQGKDVLINFFKEVGKSIISLSPSENLLSTIIEGGKYILNQGFEKKSYPIETYQIYYLFQLIKWSIIRQLKSRNSVYKQIQQLKDLFQQYILESDNWILHYSWIQIILEVISYRPVVNKSNISLNKPDQSLIKWNLLIENNLIHRLSYNKNEAIIHLFQDQEQNNDIELTSLLDNFYDKKKFVLFSQFLLKGDLTQNLNQWGYYKDFTFKKQKDKKYEDYEIILESYELDILQKLIKNLNSQQDEILSIHSEIIESFQTYFQVPSYISINIIQDHQQGSEKRFQQTYKQLIILSNYFRQLSKFIVLKLELLTPYLDQFKNKENHKYLTEIKSKIDKFKNSELTEFINELLKFFFIAIEFLSCLNEMNLFLDTKSFTDLEKIISMFEIDKFQNIFVTFEKQFNQFTQNVISYKENFLKFIQQEQRIQSMRIQIKDQNILSIVEFNQDGEQSIINKLQEIFINKHKLFDSKLIALENVQSNLIDCKFIIINLQLLKQFTNIQSQYFITIQELLENNHKNTDQNTEIQKLDQQQIVIDILTQQIQKIQSLIDGNLKESDQQSIEINLKGLLAQMESDFNLIKSEFQKFKNNNNHPLLLTLLTNAQFRILQILNQNENVQILQEILEDYQNNLNAIKQNTQISIQDFQKGEGQNEKSFSLFNKQLDNNHLLIRNIKEVKKYYKYYEKLLMFQIELILRKDQQKIDEEQQIGQQSDQQNQIEKLKEKREQYFNKKVKDSIEKLIKSFDAQGNTASPVINLKFTNYLKFFVSLTNFEENKGLKIDKTYFSIWQNIKNTYKNAKEQFLDLVDLKYDYKVREGLVYNLIRLQQVNQEQKIKAFCQKHLQYFWVFEKDQRVRNLLKNKELVEIQKQLFTQDIDNLADSIKDELKSRMQKLDNLQQEIKLEGNFQKREELQVQLKKTYQELDESLDNISEMSEAMDISLLFLKSISMDVKQIKASIDNLQHSLNQVGDDIRKLRGKRYDELLEIRKQKVLLQSKLTEIDSVYIQLTTIEYNPITGEIIKFQDNVIETKLMSEQYNDFQGEVNEFIWDQNSQKDVMLLSGSAGSGKSKAARKIEELVWKQKGILSKWIPIYVSLPALKNPKFNIFEQALESENYQFDKYQIKEFKEAIQGQKEFIILILDSYDEMKQDCFQSNLILTNKLIQEFNTPNKQMKVIITTRKEILNTIGYQTWFYGESLQTLKEVQLQNFNKEQQNEYLNQYVELSVKRKIKEVYEFVKQIAGQSYDLEELLTIWGLISSQVNHYIKKSQIWGFDGIFQNKAEELIIAKIKSHKILKILKEEQTNSLRKDLISLWSANKFKQSIKSVNIENLLTTPFMLEIVVQVLPNMAKKYSGAQQMKEIFINNYLKLKKQVMLSKIKRELYQKLNQQLQSIEENDEQLLIQEKEKEQQQKIEQAKLINIIDLLDNENFFQKYSIFSQLKHDTTTVMIDNIHIKLSLDDIKFVVTALQMKRFTVFEFYESFINFYHEEQIQKQRELGRIYNYESFAFDIYEYSYSLAIDMTLREISQIDYKPLGKLDLKSNYKIDQVTDDWLKQYFDIEDEYKKLIKSCILLSTKGSSYSFTHKSIQEFFVAKYIFDLLTSLKGFRSNFIEDQQEDFKKNEQILIKSVFNHPKFNISTDNFRGAIMFTKEQLINIETINSQLIELVKHSRIPGFCRAASNSIFLLAQMNVYLGSQDLNRINLAYTDISGLSLFDSDLSYSKFNYVEINSCNLNYADLTNAEWTNVICKEKPLLQGHKNGVLEVQFSPDGSFIVSIEENCKNIKLWDAEKYLFIKDLEGHTDNVNSITFSSDSSMLLSGSDDCTILSWDFKNPQQITSQIQVKINNKVSIVRISQDSKKLFTTDIALNFYIFNLPINSKIEECIYQISSCLILNFVLHPTEAKVVLLYERNIFLKMYTLELIDSLVSTYSQRNCEQSLVFSDNGQYFAILSENEWIIWNLKDNHIQIEIRFDFNNIIKLRSILFTKDDNELIFASEKFVFKQQKIQYVGQVQKCLETQISPKGNMAVIIYEKQLNLIDIHNDLSIGLRQFDLQPNKIQFSKDSNKLSFCQMMRKKLNNL